ncbi:acyltransferase [Streptococcus agalactiae]|uniref:acyltransferase n=1 Tax=Streptococcus agalactiae TaxID=1311 RepID=UPI000E73FC0E|nr:acyltransferase [Streptococcus agalactiae]RJX45805.1 acyltransferase [Streptococcus agalactiae]
MNRKNKSFKKFFFWSQKFYLPLVIIFLFPILICYLIGKSLTLVEVEKISNTNFFTRAIFEISPNNSIATYIVIYLLISTSLLMIFRKTNAERAFNDGHSVYLHNCYKRLWFAANILGYRKLQLIGVSIPMQFELIINGVFSEFISESSVIQYDEFQGEIIVEYPIENKKNKVINLLVCDTYDIPLEKLAADYLENTTVKISSQRKYSGNRYNNPQLVSTVREEVQKIVNTYNEVNLFMTTNPLNTQRIVGKSFLTLDRSGFDKVSVIQMDETQIYKDPFVIFEN